MKICIHVDTAKSTEEEEAEEQCLSQCRTQFVCVVTCDIHLLPDKIIAINEGGMAGTVPANVDGIAPAKVNRQLIALSVYQSRDYSITIFNCC